MIDVRLTSLDNYLALLACIISNDELSADESLRNLKLLDKFDLDKAEILKIKRNSNCKMNNNKVVLCIDPVTNTEVNIFHSLKEASETMKCDNSSISKAIKNGSKCRKYLWKYA